MRKISTFRTLFVLSLFGLAQSTLADEAGKIEYMDLCASCHGVNADGAGPLAELMNVEVPALTDLANANEGVFPMLEVIHSIDGRQGTRGHGYPMPVWGQAFERQAEADDLGRFGGEIAVRGRVLSLAYYLESIQE